MRTRTIYIAHDDTEFQTEEECAAYERDRVEFRLIGLSAQQIVAAIKGEDRWLADAILLTALRLAPEEPHEQGRRDFLAGIGGIIPERFKDDKDAANQWLAGWDEASLQTGIARAA